MTRLALIAALLATGAGCKKKEEAPAKPVQQMAAAEIQRNTDACTQYVTAVCACAEKIATVADQCKLAHALPEALQISLATAQSPDSKPDIAQQAFAAVRKTAAECIQQTAKLPSLGCP